MPARTDALAAASGFVLDIEAAAKDIIANESETAVGTVGSLDVRPNATNVFSSQVQLGVDIRDVKLVEHARDTLARLERECGVETALSRPFDWVGPAERPVYERVSRCRQQCWAGDNEYTFWCHTRYDVRCKDDRRRHVVRAVT
jgi:hypothetical protein